MPTPGPSDKAEDRIYILTHSVGPMLAIGAPILGLTIYLFSVLNNVPQEQTARAFDFVQTLFTTGVGMVTLGDRNSGTGGNGGEPPEPPPTPPID